MLHLYGIPNCDSVKKARRVLDAHGAAYTFHDFKKEGVDRQQLEAWIATAGWEKLVNRAGTTWRGLPEEQRLGITDAGSAIALMTGKPSVIKRPVVVSGTRLLIGFDEAILSEMLNHSESNP